MAYATVANVRLITNLGTSDVSNDDVTALIPFATAQLNRDINTSVIRERIDYIDTTRKNEINSSNTTYYVKNWKEGFIGDIDGDGTVGTGDITVYQVASDGTETTLTVSTITPNDGKFVLNSAPSSGVILYVTYVYAPVSVSDPHSLVNFACIYLTAALGYAKVNIGKATTQVFGSHRITRHMKSFTEYMSKYREIVNQINNRMFGLTEAAEI